MRHCIQDSEVAYLNLFHPLGHHSTMHKFLINFFLTLSHPIMLSLAPSLPQHTYIEICQHKDFILQLLQCDFFINLSSKVFSL